MTTGKSRSGRKRRPRPPAAHTAAAQAAIPRPGPPQSPKRRLRSKHIAYGVVGALMLACGGSAIYDAFRPKRCVDPVTGLVVQQSNCANGTGGARWYYGGGGGRSVGSAVNGGSFERGGFGGRVFGGSS